MRKLCIALVSIVSLAALAGCTTSASATNRAPSCAVKPPATLDNERNILVPSTCAKRDASIMPTGALVCNPNTAGVLLLPAKGGIVTGPLNEQVAVTRTVTAITIRWDTLPARTIIVNGKRWGYIGDANDTAAAPVRTSQLFSRYWGSPITSIEVCTNNT